MPLAAIGIVSADIAASVRLYRALGIVFPEELGDGPHVEGKCPKTGLRIMFDTVELVKKIQPQWVKPTGGAPLSLCFEQATPADVDAAFEAAVAAGGTERLKPWDAFWGQRYASVIDPDGNQIDLFAELPAKKEASETPVKQSQPSQPPAE